MKTTWVAVQPWIVPPEPDPPKEIEPKPIRKQWRRGPRGPMKNHAEYTMDQAMRDIDTGAAKKRRTV